MSQGPPSPEEQRSRLAQALKAARQRAGLTQVDVAHKLDVPQSYVSKYEAGNRRLDLIELVAVCDAVHTDIKGLLSEIQQEME